MADQIQNPHFHPPNAEKLHCSFTLFLSNILVKMMNFGNEIGEFSTKVNEIIELFETNKVKCNLFKGTVGKLETLG